MSEHPTPLRALLVDDEELARRYLRELLDSHADIQIVGECKNGFEAVKAVREHRPDLIFLDIQMPKLDGFEVLELLDEPPAVIFVTAYDQYALKAFEVHALDYLLKPFAADRLAECLQRAIRFCRPGAPQQPRPEPHALTAAARTPGQYADRVVVKEGTQVTVLTVAELDYAEAEGDYVCLHSGDGSWLKHQTLTSLADSLDPAHFVRIHRSTVIHLARLERVEPYSKDSRLAVLASGVELPISKSGYQRLRGLLEAD